MSKPEMTAQELKDWLNNMPGWGLDSKGELIVQALLRLVDDVERLREWARDITKTKIWSAAKVYTFIAVVRDYTYGGEEKT